MAPNDAIPPLSNPSPAASGDGDAWKPAAAPLLSRWAEKVKPAAPLPGYPRPQRARDEWLSLNGLWEYAIRPREEEERPEAFEGPILVPFAVESALSGVGRRVSDAERLWYRRTFQTPERWTGRHVLLHFGAVDWEAKVWINGRYVAQHRGGFDPFSIDITAALGREGEQELVVAVWDPTDKGTQPRGKQVTNPEGIWYTPVTGIWQTVWLEPVPETYIRSLKIVTDVDTRTVRVTVGVKGDTTNFSVYVRTHLPSTETDTRPFRIDGWGEPGSTIVLTLPEMPDPQLWSPESPFLYDLQVSIHRQEAFQTADGDPADMVRSYFGFRKISIARDKDGVPRMCLNNKPLFLFGPLDQGFWPDGLYTAPTDDALRYDVEMTRKMGFNLIRKHIKVEPARWYYWCDRLGVLVWQDMPSGDQAVEFGKGEIERTEESATVFYHELRRMIDTLHNHPSVVSWVVFNEGWGQFETANAADWVKQYDPNRLVDSASGWNDFRVGDLNDIHAYPDPKCPPTEPGRAAVLGEFGGLGLPVAGHTWQNEKNWGYRDLPSQEELAADYEALMKNLAELARTAGLSAAVYTQTSDVEGEVNGLLTYDRAVAKIDVERLNAIHETVYSAFENRVLTPRAENPPEPVADLQGPAPDPPAPEPGSEPKS